jgi:outer membrane protein assembly factor BamB
MGSLFRKFIFLLLAALPLFAQEQAQREQGLITGDPFWRQALGGAVLSLPHVQAQSAVVALDGGNIRAYSTAGTPMWNYSTRARISPYVTRSREGTSYFSRTNGTLIAINRAGRELWRRNINGPLSARVITGWDGRLFVPTARTLYCYTASGNLLWTRAFESPISVAPKLDSSGAVLLALENNEVYRIDAFGNAHMWMLTNTPAVLLSVDRQRIFTIFTDGAMEILGSAEEWYISAVSEVHSSLLPRFSSRPLAAANIGNNVAAVMNDGKIAFLSLDEKEILWEGDSHIREIFRNSGSPDLEAEMLFDERGIIVLSKNGASCFSQEGRRIWYTFLPNAAAIPAFGDDGILYSGGKDWILYAYRIEERTLPTRNSIYGPLPDGSYGMGNPQSVYMQDFPLFEHEIRIRLQRIEAAINSGRVGANEPEWTTFLLAISNSDEHVRFRINALNLLGKIGSRETIPWLVNIFRREGEPLIRAAAVSAIGAIGVDPDGSAIQNFLFTLVQGSGIQDEQLLMALVQATGALCRFSGPPLSETGVRLLTMLSADNLPVMVRRQAQRELSSLR